MAGIGEASAILGVAHVGLVFATELADFIGDYKDAGSLIKSLSDEIQATSTPLQQLGELAEKNGLYNKKFASDAQGLSQRCGKTIAELKSILNMDDVSDDLASNSKDIELTRLERLKWALQSRSKLEIPRAELGRLKLEMTLYHVTLMTMKAQSKEERNRFAYDIPGVTKELQWATAECEKMLRKRAERSDANEVSTKEQGAGRRHHRYLAREFDSAGLEGYRSYLQKQNGELREKRLQQETALRAQEEAQRRTEEDRRRKEIGEIAVLEYKSQVREQEEKAEQERTQFENRIQSLLTKVGVDEDKIGQVLKEAAPLATATKLFNSPTERLIDAQPESTHESTGATSAEPTSLFSRIFQRVRHALSEVVKTCPSIYYLEQVESDNQSGEDYNSLKAWVINHSFETMQCVPLPGEVLSQLLAAQKPWRNRKSLLERFALLDPGYQNSIGHLCERTSKSPYGRRLVYLNEVRERKKVGRWKPTKGFTHIQVILRQQHHSAADALEGTEDNKLFLDTGRENPYADHRASNLASTHLGHKDKDWRESHGSRKLSQNPIVDPTPPHDDRRSYWYLEKDGCFEGPPLAEIYEDYGGGHHLIRGRTDIFKAAINTQAVRESGYDFMEEDNKIVIAKVLSGAELDGLHEWTKRVKEYDGVTERGHGMQSSAGALVRSPHVNWDIPKPGPIEHNDHDLPPPGRKLEDEQIEYRGPKKHMISQPGDSGFVYNRRSSSSDTNVGKELVRYGYPEAVQTERYARAKRREERQPGLRKPTVADRLPKSNVRSQSPRSRPEVTFLDARTESPHGYLNPPSRSVGRGLRSSVRRPLRGTTIRRLPARTSSRSIIQSSSDWESASEGDRPLSRERSRTFSYPPPRENGRSWDRMATETSRHDHARRRDTYEEIIRRDPHEEIIRRDQRGIGGYEMERAQSPGKTVQNELILFYGGSVSRAADRPSLEIHRSDAEIIEQQLARYRDGENPASVALGTTGTQPEDSQQRSDSQKPEARDLTVESSLPNATATQPDTSRRASL